ncbi:MAG: DUF4003 domain-containing protein, partial [Lachnospiraceae bacterium]|nr:DUF4003 domain-containing protein [Lachnospiraceae bacterium]
FLASDHDICFAILLAMKEKSVEDVVEEVDEMYRILKERFAFHDSAVYSLCQVLAVYEGTPAEKCEKVTDIYNELKDAGVKYGKEYELASLGTLIDVNLETKALAAEIEETDQYLKTKKGFGFLDMGKETRYMYSAMLVSDCYAKEGTNNRVAVMEGTVAMVVEEEVALMIMMMSMLTVTTIINN